MKRKFGVEFREKSYDIQLLILYKFVLISSYFYFYFYFTLIHWLLNFVVLLMKVK